MCCIPATHRMHACVLYSTRALATLYVYTLQYNMLVAGIRLRTSRAMPRVLPGWVAAARCR
jgi:hypothetical protein